MRARALRKPEGNGTRASRRAPARYNPNVPVRCPDKGLGARAGEVGKRLLTKLTDRDARRLDEAEGYLELDLPAEALARLTQVDPETQATFRWQRMMGESHRSLDQFAAALPHLEAARRLEPADVRIHLALGWCLKRVDRLGDAIAALLEAEAICRAAAEGRPGKSVYHALVMYNLACYYSLAGKKEKVLDWLARALRLDPHFRDRVPAESDFDPYRDDPDFQAVLADAPFPEGLC